MGLLLPAPVPLVPAVGSPGCLLLSFLCFPLQEAIKASGHEGKIKIAMDCAASGEPPHPTGPGPRPRHAQPAQSPPGTCPASPCLERSVPLPCLPACHRPKS
jgi:hypothetical protein